MQSDYTEEKKYAEAEIALWRKHIRCCKHSKSLDGQRFGPDHI